MEEELRSLFKMKFWSEFATFAILPWPRSFCLRCLSFPALKGVSHVLFEIPLCPEMLVSV